ncbi:hypothetical protein C7999DRAFT_27974 [Corynascus novoguineensis]|uniref:Uncharacterized protein n=1 Tax=Corynascus novoguineensis TaxID=1126955 RepID=A0AAN7D2B1_9PEZI|nr:hypothetical protein C7999DRAFT_27974 [Corynascus novoguineensis]
MTDNSPREVSRLSSPDPAYTYLDAADTDNSKRTERSEALPIAISPPRITFARSRAVVDAPSNIHFGVFPPQGERAPPEDVLRGLIEANELSDAAIRAVLHGVKRPHDDEPADEPSAKRDKLGEELERMSASYQSAVPTSASSAGSSTVLSSVTAAHPPPLANGASNAGLPRPSVGGETSGALPIRPQGRRPPRLGNGTTMSRSGIPEVSEPPSPSDENSKHSFNGGAG